LRILSKTKWKQHNTRSIARRFKRRNGGYQYNGIMGITGLGGITGYDYLIMSLS
jgi:hypothetical protein